MLIWTHPPAGESILAQEWTRLRVQRAGLRPSVVAGLRSVWHGTDNRTDRQRDGLDENMPQLIKIKSQNIMFYAVAKKPTHGQICAEFDPKVQLADVMNDGSFLQSVHRF